MSHDSEQFQQLRKRAVAAADNSYSPYSEFPVGASVISESGRIYVGCNVENASFGLAQCAERTALSAAIADGAKPGTLTRLLIYTPGTRVHSPCGACRQVMHELMSADGEVLSCCDTDEVKSCSKLDYLPDPFNSQAFSK